MSGGEMKLIIFYGWLHLDDSFLFFMLLLGVADIVYALCVFRADGVFYCALRHSVR